jgi:hypothetical protein
LVVCVEVAASESSCGGMKETHFLGVEWCCDFMVFFAIVEESLPQCAHLDSLSVKGVIERRFWRFP